MNRIRALIPLAVMLSLAAVIMLARPGNTASSKASPALPVGFVDMDAVLAKSPMGQQAQKEARDLKDKLEDDLGKKTSLMFLTAEQRAELDKLEAKAQQSDADKARIAELKGASAKLEKELLELSQKTNASAAETDRIRELTGIRQKAMEQMRKEQVAAQQELDERSVQIMRTLQDRIFKAIEETAKDQGLAMVVHKEARLFGGVDITDAVVSKLKK
jgi:Skp family chaperone for outer membrane proteins